MKRVALMAATMTMVLLGCARGAAQPGVAAADEAGWPDFRGAGRAAISPHVPAALPASIRCLWKKPLTGLGLSGVSVAGRHVIVADKNAAKTHDIWRCLDGASGEQLWQLEYPAAGEMDYSNSPRATPVIRDGRAWLLGALGHLNCVEVASGRTLWSMNIVERFGAKRPNWGTCSTPLLLAELLIVNPGAADASLAALRADTGEVVWRAPGRGAAYASFVVAAPAGVTQIIGYDSISLGGWDARSGRRLWEVIPPSAGDYNVPTPVVVDGAVIVSTENNFTRRFRFDADGRVAARPEAVSRDLAPDTATPIAMDGMLIGVDKRLVALELTSLRTLWEIEDAAFEEFVMLIGGNGRVLAVTGKGEVLLIAAGRSAGKIIGRARLFAGADVEIWSHPAITPGRLYVRSNDCIACFELPAARDGSSP